MVIGRCNQFHAFSCANLRRRKRGDAAEKELLEERSLAERLVTCDSAWRRHDGWGGGEFTWSGHDRSQTGWSVCPLLLRVRLFSFYLSNVCLLSPPLASSSCHHRLSQHAYIRTRSDAPLSPDWVISLSYDERDCKKDSHVDVSYGIEKSFKTFQKFCSYCISSPYIIWYCKFLHKTYKYFNKLIW